MRARLAITPLVVVLACPGASLGATTVTPPGNAAVFDEGASVVPTAAGGEPATELASVLLRHASRSDPRVTSTLAALGPLGRQAAVFVAETGAAPGRPAPLANPGISGLAADASTVGGSGVGPLLPGTLALATVGLSAAAIAARRRRPRVGDRGPAA